MAEGSQLDLKKTQIQLEKQALDAKTQYHADAEVRMQAWAHSLTVRETQLLVNAGNIQKIKVSNDVNSQALPNAISALKQRVFDTETTFNPTSIQGSMAAIEPLTTATKQQYTNLVDAKIQATSALAMREREVEKQTEQLYKLGKKLVAIQSEGPSSTVIFMNKGKACHHWKSLNSLQHQ